MVIPNVMVYALMCVNVLVVILVEDHLIVEEIVLQILKILLDVILIVYIVDVVLVVEEIILSRTLVIVTVFVHLLLVRPQDFTQNNKNS